MSKAAHWDLGGRQETLRVIVSGTDKAGSVFVDRRQRPASITVEQRKHAQQYTTNSTYGNSADKLLIFKDNNKQKKTNKIT